MTTLTIGNGRTESLAFNGDWSGSATLPESLNEVILSASSTLITTQDLNDLTYYEYVGSFKFTSTSPVGLSPVEAGLTGTFTELNLYNYTNTVENRTLQLSLKNMKISAVQMSEADETADTLALLFSGDDTLDGTNFNNGDNEDGVGMTTTGDVLRGNNGNDKIYGYGGNDSLWGDRGNDSLYGGDGNDRLYGGVGNDYFEISKGSDTLNGGSGNDTFKLDFSNFVTEQNKMTIVDGLGTADVVNIYELENEPDGYDSIPIRINDGKDLLYMYYSDSIKLDTSNLTASATAYYLIKDAYKLNTKANGFVSSIETLNGYASGSASALSSAKSSYSLNLGGFTYIAHTIYGTAKNDAILGYNNLDTLRGGAGNDIVMNTAITHTYAVILDGGTGNDEIHDGGASNTIIGGLGVDTLDGGDGNDIYKFDTIKDTGITTATMDVIGQGSVGDYGSTWNTGDKIDLSAIDANSKIADNQAFSFWSGAYANSVWFDSATSIVYADATGDAKADMAILVFGVTSLAATDFSL
jgi:Ca2+-binding RTX toxin-like protein